MSTGLPYLLLPVTAEALGRARQVNDLQEALDKLGAAFVYLLDVDGREGRTWDNLGLVEDVATGSAAGPVAPTWWNTGLPRAANPSSCTRDASSTGRADSTSRSRQTVA